MLVEEGYVSGWDDPRMPTLCAMRRRGYTPAAIHDFIDRIGHGQGGLAPSIWRCWSTACARIWAAGRRRAMAVVHPLKVVLQNWPEDRAEELEMENHPDHPEMGHP